MFRHSKAEEERNKFLSTCHNHLPALSQNKQSECGRAENLNPMQPIAKNFAEPCVLRSEIWGRNETKQKSGHCEKENNVDLGRLGHGGRSGAERPLRRSSSRPPSSVGGERRDGSTCWRRGGRRGAHLRSAAGASAGGCGGSRGQHSGRAGGCHVVHNPLLHTLALYSTQKCTCTITDGCSRSFVRARSRSRQPAARTCPTPPEPTQKHLLRRRAASRATCCPPTALRTPRDIYPREVSLHLPGLCAYSSL